MSQASTPDPISPADIKAKLGDLQGEARQQVDGAKNQLVAVGAGVALLLLIVAFLLGRRGGKRASAVIEASVAGSSDNSNVPRSFPVSASSTVEVVTAPFQWPARSAVMSTSMRRLCPADNSANRQLRLPSLAVQVAPATLTGSILKVGPISTVTSTDCAATVP